jgi:hypothetical protein
MTKKQEESSQSKQSRKENDMPRYIDADALLERMKHTPRYFDIKHDIEQMPTADVVPRSEYDELLKAYAVYEEITGIKKAKKDVAREIFEEIEKFLEVALMNGHIETPILCIGFGTFFELKKKYAEEKT